MKKDVIEYSEFMNAIKSEIYSLAKSVGDEYRADVDSLSTRFATESYKLINAKTDLEVGRACSNLSYIKASLSHISSQVNLDIADRLIVIIGVALSVLIRSAIKSVI